MCGRYNFSAEESEEIRRIIAEVNQKHNDVKTGEIFPTNFVPVLLPEQEQIAPEAMVWGFPGFRAGQRTIINARSETAAEKPMFRASLRERRCVIPSTGFFEWDSQKQKYLFRLPDTAELYMAGIYNEYKGEQRFVILTTAANESIADVHNRMPVVLTKESIHDWIQYESAAMDLLHVAPPMLNREIVS